MTSRWESGSEYHWPAFDPDASPTRWPWDREDPSSGSLWGSGRDAFRAILDFGKAELGWRRLWCPDFFCQEVVASFAATGLDLVAYADDPTRSAPDLASLDVRDRDVVLLMNYFGLRRAPAPARLPAGVTLIADHTHDPASAWAWGASATDYCVASLRKTLPVPDGGALWSPAGRPLPATVAATAERTLASAEKLAAMILKASYLEGGAIQKDDFRAVSVAAEGHIASGPVSGMPIWTTNLLRTFPVERWWDARRRNHGLLRTALADTPGIEVLVPESGATPMSAWLVCDTPERRDAVRVGLIRGAVYPAVLWTLEEPKLAGIRAEAVELSRRSLSVHCDFRYGPEDIAIIAGLISHHATEV